MKKMLLFAMLLLWALASVMLSQPVRAQGAAPTPTAPGMLSPMDLMEPPPLPDMPDQADLGAQKYYYVCMACHGDRGQGLTEQWMQEWNLGRNACWASKCHASNHPPEGFKLPKNIPGVIGPVLTMRFADGLELHDYIAKNMPWHAPGSLKADEYWQLTAFLLRSNGLWVDHSKIDASNAAQYLVRRKFVWYDPTATPTPVKIEYSTAQADWVIVVAGTLSGLVLAVGLAFAFRHG